MIQEAIINDLQKKGFNLISVVEGEDLLSNDHFHLSRTSGTAKGISFINFLYQTRPVPPVFPG